MRLIDERGRLIGLVNVIDALVVILVAMVVVAGLALVFQPGFTSSSPQRTGTVVATLDLDAQPEYVVERIQEGDTYAPGGNSKLTVTDVYAGPQRDGTRTLVEVELSGPANDDTVTYAGEVPRLGRELVIETGAYETSGVIRRVGGGINPSTSRVVISTCVSASLPKEVEVGDTYRVAGREVASVESVSVYRTEVPDERRILFGLSLRTVRLDGGLFFGSTPIRVGESITFRTSTYTLTGNVSRVGSSSLPGDAATRTAQLKLEDVSPDLAESLHAGMTERAHGDTIARIESVSVRPAQVVLTTSDGEIVQREHPVKKDVTIRATLLVRESEFGVLFKGNQIKLGHQVVLDFDTVTVRATVESF